MTIRTNTETNILLLGQYIFTFFFMLTSGLQRRED